MSCYYPCLNPKAFGPFGPCPPPWIYCPPSPCCDKKDDCCDKFEPGSIALNETLLIKQSTNATQVPVDVNISWNELLHYNTFLVNLTNTIVPEEDEAQTQVEFDLYIGGNSSEESDFIKNYKKKNCISCLGHGYITNQIIVKLIGNVEVNVYKNSDSVTPSFSIINDFYKLTPTSTETDLTSHYHIFSIINDSLMPSRDITY